MPATNPPIQGTKTQRLNAALEHVAKGMTFRAAAKKFGLSSSTLHRHRHAARPLSKPGRRRALTEQEEALIVDLLLRYAARGTPLTRAHLGEAISIVVSRMPLSRRETLPSSSSGPGRFFLTAFQKRHKDKLYFSKPLRHEAKRFGNQRRGLTTHFAPWRNLFKITE